MSASLAAFQAATRAILDAHPPDVALLLEDKLEAIPRGLIRDALYVFVELDIRHELADDCAVAGAIVLPFAVPDVTLAWWSGAMEQCRDLLLRDLNGCHVLGSFRSTHSNFLADGDYDFVSCTQLGAIVNYPQEVIDKKCSTYRVRKFV